MSILQTFHQSLCMPHGFFDFDAWMKIVNMPEQKKNSKPVLTDKPLSDYMIEVLMDCHERELLKLEPYDVGSIKYVKGLIQRGMLDTKFYMLPNGKKIMAVLLTDSARSFLSSL